MAVTYYWYAWVMMILVCFFIEKSVYKRDIFIVYIIFQMVIFSYLINRHDLFTYIVLGLFSMFGLYFWLEQKRFWFHVLPFAFSLLSAGVQLFLIVNPVWSVFPAIEWAIVGIIFIVQKMGLSFFSQIGLWILVNTLGTVWSTVALTYYQTSEYMSLVEMNIWISKGIILLFLFQGIYRVNRSLLKMKRQQRNKRGVYA
ncbi:hypothetical protein MUO14_00865 [Halobacillus shinanisalinarum]|uniref:Uncharacterized protein n=1 Tax=Halobacillus shinanisalinarum TaxID=2932258 RepID=A0ABY4GZU0_9BACI|nr:hypothetical protein [Halobacillus shinanisalinarum]UOQ93594.1 hypothetical protein MUO14_00865 [Halobacillus shinanisalinarum]